MINKRKKMKIALIYDMVYPYSIGGAEYRNFSLAKELVLKGHEVHVFGMKMWSGKKTKKVTDGFYLHGISIFKQKYNFKGKRKIFDPIKYSFFLFFELMKHDFDIVDCSALPYFTAMSSKLYCVLKKKPLIITWHEVWQDYWQDYLGYLAFFGKIAEKITANLSNHNVAVSKLTKERLKKITKKNIEVIENWIDFDEIDKALPLEQKYDVISIGRHLKHKNFDLLLKIAAVSKFNLLIIGEGPETPLLLKMKKDLKLKNVDILSFTKEKSLLYRYMKSSKIFVLLSELEGFSIVSFEAMAAGLPVITLDSKRNALKDYIEDGKNGFVCKKREIEIAEKINQIIKDKNKSENMSISAIKISKKFDVKNKVTNIINYYNEIKHNNT